MIKLNKNTYSNFNANSNINTIKNTNTNINVNIFFKYTFYVTKARTIRNILCHYSLFLNMYKNNTTFTTKNAYHVYAD